LGDPYRVAIVGLGVGQLHLEALRQVPDRFAVVATCDVDRERAVAAASRVPECVPVESLEEVLASDNVDIVDLCTPPWLHASQVLAALDAGKDVVCEKPIAGSLADLDAIAEAERRTGRWVMPIFQGRFGLGLQRLKALVESGVAGPGRTATIEVSWRRRADYYTVPWRGRWATELGGVLVTQAIHALDMLIYVAGPVASVSARTSTRVNPIEVEDCAAAVFELEEGTLAAMSATLGSATEITRHRFCFENLSAESNTMAYANGCEPWTFVGDSPSAVASIDATAVAPGREGWTGQFTRLADGLRTGDGPPVKLVDARAALEVITAMYVSSRSRREVVLPISADHPAYRGWAP
jgi:predicted dehydrogenase